MNDIIINKLLVRGDNVKDSSLEFTRGVNLITGGSDTGKTHAFELIDYMFGKSEPPEYIDEQNGYSKVYLEISIGSYIYTLLRSLNDTGIIKVYKKKIDMIDEKTQFKKYKVSTKSKDSISSFYMKNLGYNDKLYLRKNKKNDLQQLSFRNYIKNFMISEEKITAKSRSIIETELTHPKKTFTEEKLIFFLTNMGNKQKVKKKKKNLKIPIKIEMLEEIIAENDKIIKSLQDNIKKYDKYLKNNVDINTIQERIEKLENSIEDAKADREELLNEIKHIENKIIGNKSTVSRFNVLAKQYRTEMNRLDFLYEAESFLSQIEHAKCPLCDRNLESNKRNLDEIHTAFNAEWNKIAVKELDIKETIEDLKKKAQDMNNEKKVKEELLKDIEKNIHGTLTPQLNNLIKYYSNILEANEIETKYKVYQEENNNLRSKIQTLNSMYTPDEKTEDINIDKTIFINRRKELCDEMEELLEKFKFAKEVNITYDENEIDFIINGNKRKAKGQGYSALVYISYVLALKKIMDKYKIPSPNFIIFDSPFTSLKEGDEMKEKKVKVSSQIVDSFFKYCAKEYKDKQLILFENSDEKFKNLDLDINKIHFTKNKNFGRYGFYK